MRFLFFLILLSPCVLAQGEEPLLIRLGLHSGLCYQPPADKPYIGQSVPPWQITPNIAFSVGRRELIIGPDFFFAANSLLEKPYLALSGGQLEVKHYYKQNEKLNFYLSSGLQFSRFLNGTPITSYYATPKPGSHAVFLKTKSTSVLIGGGMNFKFFSRLNVFISAIAGLSYTNIDVLMNYSLFSYSDEKRLAFLGQVRGGMAVDLYRK